ncbi:MAG: hypothetical protein GY861_02640 [bacterium]|nr:hypothetical protein [bacterium]
MTDRLKPLDELLQTPLKPERESGLSPDPLAGFVIDKSNYEENKYHCMSCYVKFYRHVREPFECKFCYSDKIKVVE